MYETKAQVNYTITEDFESYKSGDYLGVVNPNRWKVLFDDPGTITDVKVSSVKARSGKNSIYLFSNIQGGGPENIYMPFFKNDKMESFGEIDFKMWLYIPADQGAYFNFQAINPVAEAMNFQVYFDNAKSIRLVSENNQILGNGTFQQDKWINFHLKANLTNNEWKIDVDGKSIATLALEVSSLYALNITPMSAVNQSQFYIDDIEYTFTQSPIQKVDASITPIILKDRFLVGKSSAVSAQIRNVGTDLINSVELEYSYGTTTKTQILNNLNLKSLTNTAFTLNDNFVAQVGLDKVSINIKKVNGEDDNNTSNNLREKSVEVIVPAEDKKILAEQATGTWCQWCPRGHVLMELMEKEYNDYFVGIAVHGSGNDPMRMNAYVEKLKIEGYPSVVVDRNTIIDPLELENAFFDYITLPVAAKIDTRVQWSNIPRTLNITPKAIFKSGAKTGSYKMVVILAENNIKGTTNAYNQVNAYGSGQAGPMGGFEKLPTVVPYSKMTYKHVARNLLNGFDGQSKSFATINEGDIFEGSKVTYEVPASYNLNELEIITCIVDPSGKVSNASMIPAANFILDAQEVDNHPYFIGISPNPANSFAYIDLNIAQTADVLVKILDINGRMVAFQDFGKMNGAQKIALDVSNYPNGQYIVQIQLNNEILSRKIIKQ